MSDGFRSTAQLTCTRRRGTARGGRQQARTTLLAHAFLASRAANPVPRTSGFQPAPARDGAGAVDARPAGVDPVDLGVAIEDAARVRGSRGVVDLLVGVFTGSSVTSDDQIDRHLDRLRAACRQTGRIREIIPVIKRIAVLNPARAHEVAAELAIVHAHLGDRDKGVALLASAFAAQRRLAPQRRSAAFGIAGEIAARVLGELEMSREIVALARSTTQDLAVAASIAAPRLAVSVR
jgi:hypothetical protein